MLNTVCLYIIYFFFYSAVGWLGESIYCSVGARRPVNRGFLTGPMCPIYGTGTLVLSVCLYPFREHLVFVFFAGVVLCDIVEYITSYLMEKLFHARWWDYSNEFMNLHGRICLKHSIYWGAASVGFVWLIHPYIEKLFLEHLDERLLLPLSAVILSVFTIDVINSVRKALDIRKLQMKLQRLAETIEQMPVQFKNTLEELVDDIHVEVIKTGDKLTGKRRDAVEQLQDLLSNIEQKLKPAKKDKTGRKRFRQIYSNPYLIRNLQGYVDRIRGAFEKAQNSFDKTGTDTDK